MNRAFLCSAIEGVVSERGYDFSICEKSYYPTIVCRYPAAFMSQPEFVRQEGRNHGRITYNVSLRLARQGAKLTPKERNALLAEMEEQMTEIFIELSRDKSVAVVDNLTIKPLSEAVDVHGAVSLEANADVETIF